MNCWKSSACGISGWRERDGTEHDAEQIRRDAADDEEDGQVLENDGQNGRQFAGDVKTLK